jgi:hypothetical protein
MKKILISDKDLELLTKLKKKEVQASCKKFHKRKKCHTKDAQLKSFFENSAGKFNMPLFTIPFKCFFSFYLYVYLKGKAEKFELDLGKEFKVSKPLEINFSEISRLSGIPMGTVKSAFRELKKFGFLLYSEELKPDNKNGSNCVLLVNDYYIIEHDTVNERTLFKIILT